MQILKRNGTAEPVKFDKITGRIEGIIATFDSLEFSRKARLTESRRNGEPFLDIDPIMVSQKVCSSLIDNIKSEEIDKVASEVAQSLCLNHPDYSVLAGLICISNLQKCTPKTFIEYVEESRSQNILSEETSLVSKKHADALHELMRDTDDYAYDFFAYKVLEKSYLTKDAVTRRIIERPQYMWMRVAVGIHGDDIEAIAETYTSFISGMFTHASPTLFNAGTIHPQLASCFLLEIEDDSMEGIFDTLKDSAMISKFAGGLGIHISKIRGNGSHIAGTNGTSSGIIPMCSVFEKTLKFSDQSSKRAGSAAMFLEPWHVDIEEFLELRLPTGAEERRCRDLFTAMFINDIFMRRVKNNQTWSLFNEHTTPGLTDKFGTEFDTLYEKYESEGLWVKQVNAQDIWMKICYSAIMTGTPYITFKDAVNNKTNQSNIGVIKSSNLCVAPETMILTNDGYFQIETLEDQTVSVWNGKEFSEIIVFKTGQNEKLIKVSLSNGSCIECTEQHKFYVNPEPNNPEKVVMVEAKDLNTGMSLVQFELPQIPILIDDTSTELKPDKAMFTYGVFSAIGGYCNNTMTPLINVPAKHIKLLNDLCVTALGSYNFETHTQVAYLDHSIHDRFTVPINKSPNAKISWLTGFIYTNPSGYDINPDGGLQMTGIHHSFFIDILYMLQTIGVHSSVYSLREAGTIISQNKSTYHTPSEYVLVIPKTSLVILKNLGLVLRFGASQATIPDIDQDKMDSVSRHTVNTTVISVVNEGRVSDTYCFTEPNEHKAVFNGNLLGNCNEIMQVSTPTETAVCNLASVNPVACIDRGTNTFDFNMLGKNIQILVRNLNKVIDRTFYPTEKCRLSNLRHRPMGIGLSGLHTTFMVMRYPFESPEAKQLNKDIYECMYYHAVKESCNIAKINGAYDTFHGSPLSKGKFQFDLWGVTPSSRYDWETLRADVMSYGVRNSLVLACMPTASSASIIGNSESNDPINSNLYSRKTSAGEHMIVNRFLVADLIKLGLWNSTVKDQLIASEGSVQYIPEFPDHLKTLYKSCFEMSMRSVIEMSADRGVFICQSQSLNLFMIDPTVAKVSSMLFYSWTCGLKSGMYYLRTKARGSAAKFTIDPTVEKNAKTAAQTKNETQVCRRDDPDCIACSA